MISRLYNVTDASEVAISTAFVGPFGDRGQRGEISGRARISIASAKAFAIQYFASGAETDGLGLAANLDSKSELYTRVTIRRG